MHTWDECLHQLAAACSVGWQEKTASINPFTATGYFDIPPPRWPTFLVTLFPILKEGMGLSLLDEFEVQYHVIKK